MTVIPESKLGLQGNHECVKLLSYLAALVQHPWALSCLLHNQIISREKKWYPTDPKFLSSGMRFSHKERVWRVHIQTIPHGESPRGWTSWSKACPPSLLWEIFQFRRQTSLSHSPQYNPFPKLPFGLAHWITSRRTPGLLQDHPKRRSQCETGQLSLATETRPPILPQIPSKLPLIRIWKQHLPNAGKIELHNDFCKINKIEDSVGIEMNWDPGPTPW